MNKFIAFFFALALGSSMHAQFGTAPDFTVTDIDGNTHSLYADILDQGKIAVVQVAATWCPPCWNLHTTGALQELHEAFGPDGTDQLRVIIYEADPGTTLADLNGTGFNTTGDWLTGVTHPIINESPITLPMSVWRPFGYPVVNIVRPSDYEIVLDTRNATSFQAQTDAINGANIDGIVLGVTTVEGCTDPEACNYNVEADSDDGSCDFDVCVGCTYPLASNYDVFATVEDGSCQFVGCTNATAVNYNPYANVEDGSCDYDTTTSGCPTDVDGDGSTGTQDLLLFLGSFGQTCLD